MAEQLSCGVFTVPTEVGVGELSGDKDEGVSIGNELLGGEGGIVGIRKINGDFDLGYDGLKG